MSFKRINAFHALQRRAAMRLAVCGAMGLMLAACGGGGGSSDDAQALRDAFAKLHDGMTTSDVEALVGFSANWWRTTEDLGWIVGGVKLHVGFSSNNPKIITNATLTEADGVNNQQRSFNY
ncbi:MAG: hypothetical protein JNK17_04630 [Hydrogenophaga sp.]|nr:hypothetical protein [Hydrogenophaga sp.]